MPTKLNKYIIKFKIFAFCQCSYKNQQQFTFTPNFTFQFFSSKIRWDFDSD